MDTKQRLVLLQCGEHEAQVTASAAKVCARALADEFRQTVYLRNPLTDGLLGAVHPSSARGKR
jgi:hypothetical protein